MPFVPPPNQAGIPLPAPPSDPPTIDDCGQAREYLNLQVATAIARNQYQGGAGPNPATSENITRADAYYISLLSSFMGQQPGPAVNQNQIMDAINDLGRRLTRRLDRIERRMVRNERAIDRRLKRIERRLRELPVLLANGRAWDSERLYDPTRPLAWAHLDPPHPRTRFELNHFTAAQCIESARVLRLSQADLPEPTLVLHRRRQIGNRLGVQVAVMPADPAP